MSHATKVRKLIGLTGQYASVDDTLTGLENLLLIGRLTGQSRNDAKSRAREQLAAFRLEDAADKAAKTYSGGMRRRLDLAASLVARPRVLFLDEPTTGLDPRSRNEMWDVVRGLSATGVTVLLTTQYLEEADRLATGSRSSTTARLSRPGRRPSSRPGPAGRRSWCARPARPTSGGRGHGGRAHPHQAGGPQHHGDRPGDRAGCHARHGPPAGRPGVRVAELTLRGSTLDEVFLSLTGHRTEELNESAA